MDDAHNVPSEGIDSDEILLGDIDAEPTNLQYKQKADWHEQVQHWTDTLYSLAIKILIILLGTAFLIDIIWPHSNSTIEIVSELYRLSLEQGRMEILVPAVAILFLVRNLPIFLKGAKRMFDDP